MIYSHYNSWGRVLCASVIIVSLLMIGCGRNGGNIEVAVRNRTANALYNVQIELICDSSDSGRPRVEGLRPNEYVYAARLIKELQPGASIELMFPKVKGGEAAFRIKYSNAAGDTFSGWAGYLEWYTEVCEIVFSNGPSGIKIEGNCR